MKTFFAHSVEGKPVDEWHWLEKHLFDTAKLAAQFAAEFGCGEWGYLAGLWHDLGKYFIGVSARYIVRIRRFILYMRMEG